MALSLILHWIHLLAAIAWIGGIIFNLLVLTPSLPSIELRQRSVLARRALQRFLFIVWGSIVAIVATGLYRVFFVNRMANLEAFLGSAYGLALTAKVFLVLAMILIAALFTLSLFPRISGHLSEHEVEAACPSACTKCGSLLKGARLLMVFVLALALIVVLLAAFLRGA